MKGFYFAFYLPFIVYSNTLEPGLDLGKELWNERLTKRLLLTRIQINLKTNPSILPGEITKKLNLTKRRKYRRKCMQTFFVCDMFVSLARGPYACSSLVPIYLREGLLLNVQKRNGEKEYG